MTGRHDLKDINLRLLDNLDRLASQYGLEKRHKSRSRAEARFGDGKNPGLVVYLSGKRQGRWIDFRSDESGSLIDLVGRQTGRTGFGEALQEALAFLGIAGEAPQEPDPEILETRRRREAADRLEDERKQTEDLQIALGYWRAAVPIAGTMAADYLRARGLVFDTPSGRFAEAVPFDSRKPHGPAAPCLLWAVAGGPDRKITGVQRTWLERDPRGIVRRRGKRLMLGRQLGNAVRLAAPGPILGLAEGCETAIAAMLRFGIPVWGALTRCNFHLLPLPEPVRELVLFGDADEEDLQAKILRGEPVSHPAARGLANCVAARAAEVRSGRLDRLWLCVPEGGGGRDWNDVHLERKNLLGTEQ